MPGKRIVVVDDQPIVRAGLRAVLDAVPEWKVVADAATYDEALAAVRSVGCDVVILDVGLGERTGLDLLKQLRIEFPRIPVLILSVHAADDYALRCLRAGAAGYLTKASAPESVIEAVERVTQGKPYMSDEIAEQLAARAADGRELLPHERLSDRERDVFRQLIAGRSVTEIANALSLSVKTVSTHRSHILQKMRMHSTADLIRYAIAHRLE
ncbi:MAG TPA: response regulator transcription factor [Thermoanaerobaculia bacterium]|nr:response regulator transcription factor [Thermoanaerobaculia bacterium]